MDRRKFSKRNNQYVNGALYDHIPSSCGQIVPDNMQNSRIILKVRSDLNTSSQIIITKFHQSRLGQINRFTSRFHDAFQSISLGKLLVFNIIRYAKIIFLTIHISIGNARNNVLAGNSDSKMFAIGERLPGIPYLMKCENI